MKFERIAEVVKEYRLEAGLSQLQLSHILGYQNGQFISNVERGQCSVPFKKVTPLCDALDCHTDDIVEAMVADYEGRILNSL